MVDLDRVFHQKVLRMWILLTFWRPTKRDHRPFQWLLGLQGRWHFLFKSLFERALLFTHGSFQLILCLNRCFSVRSHETCFYFVSKSFEAHNRAIRRHQAAVILLPFNLFLAKLLKISWVNFQPFSVGWFDLLDQEGPVISHFRVVPSFICSISKPQKYLRSWRRQLSKMAHANWPGKKIDMCANQIQQREHFFHDETVTYCKFWNNFSRGTKCLKPFWSPSLFALIPAPLLSWWPKHHRHKF